MRNIRKIVAVGLVLSMICLAGISSAYAIKPLETLEGVRTDLVIESIAEGWNEERQLSRTTTILDFDGNEYILAEFEPTGYMIFNQEAAIIVESAENSPSPYMGLDGELFYGGPTRYYIYDGVTETYQHTVIDSPINSDQAELLAEKCRDMQVNMTLQADNEVKEYIEGGDTPNSIENRLSSSFTYVAGRGSFFENLDTATEMGYATQGKGLCGYVAAGILLLYYHVYGPYGLINPRYLNSSGTAFNGGDFTFYLRNTYGQADGTTALNIETILNEYLAGVCNLSPTTWSELLTTKGSILTQLRAGRPVIYSDELDDPKHPGETTKHIVVVYGYDSNDNFVAHFGWENYSHVQVSAPVLSIFGSSACSIISLNG